MKNKVLRLIAITILGLGTQTMAQIFQSGNGVTDIDGNFYPTIIINGKEWMETNLNVNHYNNGNSILNIQNNSQWSLLNSGAYSYYNNDSITYAQYYGKIYNWYVVNDARGVCPTGWSVPTDDDWKSLELFLGMTVAQSNTTSWRGTNEGTKLKSTIGWNSNGNGTNESGINAFPGGRRNPNGNFSDLGNEACFWTSTGQGSLPFQNGYDRRIKSIYTKIYRLGESVKGGFYVRCIKDGFVGIENIQQKNFELFPNPASTKLYLNGLKNNDELIFISNLLGELIKTIHSDGATNVEINIENIPTGIYFIKINNISYKFIKL